MRSNHCRVQTIVAVTGFLLAGLPSLPAYAQAAAALTGVVSSAEEANMEGVLVSAKKDGSTITVTVVSDLNGNFSFPADRLSPGKYAITTRAAGYSLIGPKDAIVTAGETAKADITLGKSKNMTAQLSNAEWLISTPGGDRLKQNLTSCVGCHSLQRIFTSSHSPEEFRNVFKRMAGYAQGSIPSRPQLQLATGVRQPVSEAEAGPLSEWIYSVNLSNPDHQEYAFKSLPRPKGANTKVIITTYDLPRKEAQPHDVIVDRDGTAWYSDFGSMFVGTLDPKTGQVTDIPIPVLRPEQPKSTLDLEFDPGQKNVWVALMYQAGVAKIDRQSKQVTTYPFPADQLRVGSQSPMVSPQHSDADGKVWIKNQDPRDMYRLDVATGQYESVGQSKDPGGKTIDGYGMPTDLQNNVYLLDFGGTSIGLRDGKMTTIYRTPIDRSKPRRGLVDAQNRLWFAEFGGNAIGVFDPKTAAIKEYPLPTPWSAPYDVVPSKDASEVWTGSMFTDLVSRLDTKTGAVTEYLLPATNANIRRTFLQETGGKPILWIGNNLGASIIKVERID